MFSERAIISFYNKSSTLFSISFQSFLRALPYQIRLRAPKPTINLSLCLTVIFSHQHVTVHLLVVISDTQLTQISDFKY